MAWKPTHAKSTGGGNKVLTIATGSFDATMGIWRRKPDNGGVEEEKREVHTLVGALDEGEELEIEIGSDGRPKEKPRLIQGNDDEDSENEDDWEFAIVLEGHDSEIKNVAYSPSGQWLASCSRDKSIWIWEEIGEEGEDEFETVAVLQEHTADVKCVCWRRDDGNGEVLASASYDDTIRLWREDGEGEWGAFATLEAHEGTVWSLDWEPEVSIGPIDENSSERQIPRLISSSADTTIRIWSRIPTPPPPNRPSYFNPSIPSTMRPAPADETWTCTTLPPVHDLPIYSVSWSRKTGRVVSTGGDGRVAIYEERTKGRSAVGGPFEKEWVVLAVLEGGHGPYEINHVTWCKRYDSGKREEGEEMIVTTGDDGVVRAWAVEGDLENSDKGLEDKIKAVELNGEKTNTA